jgi:hypothetical protein
MQVKPVICDAGRRAPRPFAPVAASPIDLQQLKQLLPKHSPPASTLPQQIECSLHGTDARPERSTDGALHHGSGEGRCADWLCC